MRKKSIKQTQTQKKLLIHLAKKARWVRKKVLSMTVNAGAGHIAPSFSCIEILVVLYQGRVLRVKPNKPKWGYRDRFILSKGQAAVALYAILADRGFFPVSELKKFTRKGSYLGGHTEDTIPGVEAFTGSLGHGLSIGAGLALAAKMDKKKYRTIVLLGDGECHEGSVWEAAMFSAHHQLNNLIAIIDNNGLSATDFLKNYLEIKPLQKKWESFGWEVIVVDGHSYKALLSSLSGISSRHLSKRPLAIIALTTKGKGVSFMQNNPIWHYRIPVGKELKIAQKELTYIRREVR